MGSRYLYIVLNVWLERLLTRGDYRRPASESFTPWAAEHAEGTRTTTPSPQLTSQ
jgi:hypothetical protein